MRGGREERREERSGKRRGGTEEKEHMCTDHDVRETSIEKSTHNHIHTLTHHSHTHPHIHTLTYTTPPTWSPFSCSVVVHTCTLQDLACPLRVTPPSSESASTEGREER